MLKEMLKENIMRVVFTKKDGSERVMICTLQEEYLPETFGNTSGYNGIITVYDLESEGWRSFREDSVIDYSKEPTEET